MCNFDKKKFSEKIKTLIYINEMYEKVANLHHLLYIRNI